MDKFREHIYISKLLAKERLGILSVEEKTYLQEWLSQDKENHRILEDLRMNLPEELRKEQKDPKLAWEKFKENHHIEEHRKQGKVIKIWWQAAAAIAILAIGSIWWLSPEHHEVQMPSQEYSSIEHSKEPPIYKDQKGVLLLSDGNSRELNAIDHPDSSYNLSAVLGSPSGATEQAKLNTIVVPKGAEFKVKLPDGTIAWINSASSLSFPSKFTTDRREISISGEVCLDVAHQKNQPFIIRVNNQRVKVLGTLFNIEAYPGSTSRTTLVRGKIEVQVNDKKIVLRPNEQFVKTINGHTEVQQVNASESIQWIEGNFEFNDESIEEIMTKLSRWYDVSFNFTHEQKKQARYTLQVERKEALSDVLRKLELTGSIRFKLKNKQIQIF